MLAQMGIMTQLVARNIEVGIAPDLAVSVMSAIAVIGIIGAVIFGRILFRLGHQEGRRALQACCILWPCSSTSAA